MMTGIMDGLTEYQQGYLAGMRFITEDVIKVGVEEYMDDMKRDYDLERGRESLHLALLRETLKRFAKTLMENAEFVTEETLKAMTGPESDAM